ncbi:hypothetical protein MEQU1_001623 [Malassezia equina]|uniref:Uncharacterized protein n=1 Tax=Malassezia equina TaxID=1381935 RepID=A0AAF0IZ05_9BASI|nr:hypothetical protein MEQU1_001623 [Malassezia equina]
MLTVRQIYKNYASKSVEGLSFVFLLQWTIGDLTNFIGAFLTKQLPIQIVIAAYMLIVDLTLCAQYAMLYMTSRLPQIWANYKRKSVHGLSWLLFLLAFLANLLYSLSILSNPKAVGPSSRQFLSESLPFLIGSGGTLVFDLIILIQYWMWHDRSSTKEGPHDEA